MAVPILTDMSIRLKLGVLLVVSVLGTCPEPLHAQYTPLYGVYDCRAAISMCTDTTFRLLDSSTGFHDFRHPYNNNGCLYDGETERGGWFYIRFSDAMPAGLDLEFTLRPLGASREDYDFALWGPDTGCDSLGIPLRCSYARTSLESRPSVNFLTGLRAGQAESSEDRLGDGFVAPLRVEPGQRYYLYINHWLDDTVGQQYDQGFRLEWGGAAAAYLRCNDEPDCAGFRLQAPDTLRFCGTASGVLPVRLAGALAAGQVRWQGNIRALAALDRSDILAPTIHYEQPRGDTLHYLIAATAGNCMAERPLVVIIRPLPALQVTGGGSYCAGTEVPLRADPIVAGMHYRWSTGEQTPVITVHRAGTYTLVATTPDGCITTLASTVSYQPPEALSISGPRIFCAGDSVELHGSSGFVNYQWNDGYTGRSRWIRQGGHYTLTASDAAGCTVTQGIDLVSAPPPQPRITAAGSWCGGNQLTLALTEAFASYRWSTGDSSAQISVARNETYSVTVTTASGCRGAAAYRVQAATLPALTVEHPAGLCPGDSAWLRVPAAEGWTYRWSTGATAPAIRIGKPGQYAITATNVEGCTVHKSIQVEAFMPPPLRLPVDTLYYCEGEEADISAPPGFATYHWSDGFRGPVRSLRTAGSYHLLVTDVRGCRQTDSLLLLPLRPTPLTVMGNEPFCAGDSIQLRLPPGWREARWSNGNQDMSLTVDRSDTLTIWARDERGCQSQTRVYTTKRPAPEVSITGDRRLCSGASAELRAPPAFADYRWNTSAATPSVWVAQAGTYSLTVTDTWGCSATATHTLEAVAAPRAELRGNTRFCPGDTVHLSLAGDYARAVWPDGSSGTRWSYSEPLAGQVQLFSEAGCRTLLPLRVEQLPLPPLPPLADRRIDCRDTVVAIAAGPSADVQFEWQRSGFAGWSTADTLHLSRAGDYLVRVRALSSGCRSAIDTVRVTDRRFVPVFHFASQDTIRCDRPQATLRTDLPASAYDWQWLRNGTLLSAAPVDSLRVGLGGWYQLRATHQATGCTAERLAYVATDTLRPKLRLSGPTALTCRDGHTQLRASFSQAGPAPAVRWSDDDERPLGNDTILMIDQPGRYRFQVTNPQNGCSALATQVVNDERYRPSATVEVVQPLSCTGAAAQLRLLPATGRLIAWYQADQIIGHGPYLFVESPGWYPYTLVDTLSGCGTRDSVYVAAPTDGPLHVELAIQHPICRGDADGFAQVVTVMGGEAPYRYRLDGAAFQPADYFALPEPGQYQLRVIDRRGCSIDTGFQVRPGHFIEVDLGQDTVVRYGSSLRLQPRIQTSGQRIAHWQWTADNGQACPDCHDWALEPVTDSATYTLALIDEYGCSSSDSRQVITRVAPRWFVPTAFSPNGDDRNDILRAFLGEDVSMLRHFRLFDRWGGLVLQLADRTGSDISLWDGSWRGRPAASGSYIYYLEVETIDGRRWQQQGEVHLRR